MKVEVSKEGTGKAGKRSEQLAEPGEWPGHGRGIDFLKGNNKSAIAKAHTTPAHGWVIIRKKDETRGRLKIAFIITLYNQARVLPYAWEAGVGLTPTIPY